MFLSSNQSTTFIPNGIIYNQIQHFNCTHRQQSAVELKLNHSHDNALQHMVLGISNCHLKDIVKMSRDMDLCNIVDYPLISTLGMMNLPAAAVCTITAPSHDVSEKIYSG